MDTEVMHLMARKQGLKTPSKPSRQSKKSVESKAPESGLLSRSIQFLNQKLGIASAEEKAPQSKPRTRAKLPADDISKPARDAIVDQQILTGLTDLVINIDPDTYAKLDKLDQDALEAWHANYKQLARHKGERRDFLQQKVDLERIVNLYKVYGSSENAVVSQATNPFSLTVKNRKQAHEKQL